MAKQDKLPFRLSFRCDDPTLEGLEELSIKLKMGQSEVLRIAVKRLMETYLHLKSDILIMGRPEFDKIIDTFTDKVTKNSREASKRLHSDYMQVIHNIFEQPAIKEALKSVSIEDIKIDKKQ